MLTGTCCLLDPQLVQYTAQFYITQSVWIVHCLEKCREVYTCTYIQNCFSGWEIHVIPPPLPPPPGGCVRSSSCREAAQGDVCSARVLCEGHGCLVPHSGPNETCLTARAAGMSLSPLSPPPPPLSLPPPPPPPPPPTCLSPLPAHLCVQVTPFVDCCVSLLERPDLLPHPLTQSRIVSVLLAFVDSDKRGSQPE